MSRYSLYEAIYAYEVEISTRKKIFHPSTPLQKRTQVRFELQAKIPGAYENTRSGINRPAVGHLEWAFLGAYGLIALLLGFVRRKLVDRKILRKIQIFSSKLF